MEFSERAEELAIAVQTLRGVYTPGSIDDMYVAGWTSEYSRLNLVFMIGFMGALEFQREYPDFAHKLWDDYKANNRAKNTLNHTADHALLHLSDLYEYKPPSVDELVDRLVQLRSRVATEHTTAEPVAPLVRDGGIEWESKAGALFPLWEEEWQEWPQV